MGDKLTFIWAILAALITTLVGLAVNYAVEARWIAPLVMLGTMIALVAVGRIRRKVRERARLT